MWTLAPVVGRAVALVQRLDSEAQQLDGHSTPWTRRLPPLLREAANFVADLETRLVHKQDEIAALRLAAARDRKRILAAEARAAELEREAKEQRAAVCELAEVRAGLEAIKEFLTLNQTAGGLPSA